MSPKSALDGLQRGIQERVGEVQKCIKNVISESTDAELEKIRERLIRFERLAIANREQLIGVDLYVQETHKAKALDWVSSIIAHKEHVAVREKLPKGVAKTGCSWIYPIFDASRECATLRKGWIRGEGK